MYLEKSTAKGYTYLYLKMYQIRDNYSQNSVILYRFGRIERAFNDMVEWYNNPNLFPDILKNLGCNHKDLLNWIETVEIFYNSGKLIKS